MRTEIVLAEAGHIAPIVEDVRAEDRRELWLQGRATPESALVGGLRRSSLAMTGLVDGRPVCMFGVAPFSILLGQGVPWMVGANGLRSWTAQRALLELSRPAVDAMHRAYPMLANAVHADNRSAIRWLSWLGFTLLDPAPIGFDGSWFRPFYRVKSDA